MGEVREFPKPEIAPVLPIRPDIDPKYLRTQPLGELSTITSVEAPEVLGAVPRHEGRVIRVLAALSAVFGGFAFLNRATRTYEQRGGFYKHPTD